MKRAIAIVSACLMTGSCTTYDGSRLSLADKSERDIGGIPYVLTKPEFTLTRTNVEGEARPTYTLGVSYVPDSSQLYTLKLDPSVFHDPEFTMNFGQGSTLASTKSTYSENITPYVTALGTLASHVAGIVIKGVADSETIRSILRKRIAAEPTCKKNATGPAYLIFKDYRESMSVADPKNVGEAITERMFFLYDEDKDFVQSFHAISEDEITCLKAVAQSLIQSADETAIARSKEFSENWKAFLDSHKDDPYANVLKRAIDDKSISDIEALTKRHALLNARVDLLTDILGADQATRDAAIKKYLVKQHDDQQFVEDLKGAISAGTAAFDKFIAEQGKAANDINVVNDHLAASVDYVITSGVEEVAKAIDSITTADISARRGRLLMYLQALEERSAFRYAESSVSQYRLDADNLERLIERVVDRDDLYKRRRLLEATLAKSWPGAFTSAGQQVASPPPFVQARQELDETNKRIGDEKAKILAAALPAKTKAPEPIKPRRISFMSEGDFKKLTITKDSDEFVIVLKEY